MADAFPLAWPMGWPRTPASALKDGQSTFAVTDHNAGTSWRSRKPITFAKARDSLRNAIARLDGHNVVISTNYPLNRDGWPMGGRRKPDDEGVAVYFQRGGRTVVMARDAYFRIEDNMRSLALALESLATLERHGGGVMMDRAFEGFTALPAPKRPHEILGVRADVSEAEIRAAWRRLIAEAHPDQDGGSNARAAELNAARDAMLKGARS